MAQRDILDIKVKNRHFLRIAVDGRPLYYVSVIGNKKASIP
jgi:hypothetical protein